MRRIVQKIPYIEEIVTGHAATRTFLQVIEPRNISAKLDCVPSVNLCGHVLKPVSPLVENTAHVRPKGIERNATRLINSVCGKPDRRLWIGVEFIPAPSRRVDAELVQQVRRKGVIPDCRQCFIDLRVMEDVVGAVSIEVVFGEGNIVDGKVNMVLLSDIRIQTAIVLRSRKFGGVHRVVVRDICHSTQATANAGIATAGPGLILGTQARGQRRADVEALARNCYAVHAFR